MKKTTKAKNPRLENLRKLCEDYNIKIKKSHFNTTSEEDISAYFTDPPTETVDKHPWAAVTKGFADYVIYYITLHAERKHACAGAEMNVNDDMYPEWPVEVRNLDTGEAWFPSEPQYTWEGIRP